MTPHPTTVRAASASDHPAVLALYERCGYGGGVSPGDELFVAEREGELLGVVRLCTSDDATVLRGMQIHPAMRRMGVGSRLLDRCVEALGDRTCYCLPYDHLIGFYGRVGFRLASAEALPPFLRERLRRYRSGGTPVVAMVRVA